MTLDQLPMPDGAEKETVVRVNTNRLNRVPYWFCLDKAGPEEKLAVKTALTERCQPPRQRQHAKRERVPRLADLQARCRGRCLRSARR
jgi:hypothetical protein